jgi:hypothetical protein
MDSFDSFQDKEFDQLNEAILKAIISSKDVDKVLQDFKAKDLINEMAVVNLILNLEELSGLMFSDSQDEKTFSLEPSKEKQSVKKEPERNLLAESPKGKAASTSPSHHLVDGEILSRNEILFEKFYQGKFNEKQWLKQAKIKI